VSDFELLALFGQILVIGRRSREGQPMKRLLAAMVAALMMVSLLTSVAFASNGNATKFTAAYPNGATTWTCSGVHVVNRNMIKDSETCVISGDLTGYVAGTYTSTDGSWGILPPFGSTGWITDYSGGNLYLYASSWTITMVDNLNGTFTANIVAYYPAS
jgi:hypothetical protein